MLGGDAVASDGLLCRVGVVGGVGRAGGGFDVGICGETGTGEAGERSGEAGGAEETVDWGGRMFELRRAVGARISSMTASEVHEGALARTFLDKLGAVLGTDLAAITGRLGGVGTGIGAVRESQ